MLLEINNQNPETRKIKRIAEILRNGGVIIYPTDTVYGLGCDIFQKKAVEKICRLRRIDPQKANLTIICSDIKQVAEYAHQIDNTVFKILKKNLPGPFTFVLKASRNLPKLISDKRKSVGVRVPDNNIAQAIIEELGNPILSISLKSDDEIREYFTDPYEIHEDFEKLVDIVVDGGNGHNQPSTVVEMTNGEITILRQGIGDLDY